MKHIKTFNHLSRKHSHRKSMLANMAISLIMHKRINTTVAKAKALRVYVEPLLTKSKEDSTNSRRVVFSYLQNKEAVTELFREVSQKIANRNGGYTRIIKTGLRLGDAAEMCFIELVVVRRRLPRLLLLRRLLLQLLSLLNNFYSRYKKGFSFGNPFFVAGWYIIVYNKTSRIGNASKPVLFYCLLNAKAKRAESFRFPPAYFRSNSVYGCT